ncbi:hypothetical protein H696_01895 [Fonticula alba]|uniref:Flotillin C-terminal domain-containing protein n=1 Tax=Fonticula alba TaxID=691883 RepID=A0A058ZAE4_FONAL|nr:hypothetical protein H696_01895 [Fonticula alba]KCV70948.1 hypothetical protein H696_01895 [Fonticula alba]|eukprot:XP_009494071.1 hypothetical protein H696_01895 [Fonticula alba]
MGVSPLRDVSDDSEYLNSLGVKRTAEVKRDARIGEAAANSYAKCRQDTAVLKSKEATDKAETAIREAEMKFRTQKAKYDAEVAAERAKASKAGELQTARTMQEVEQANIEIDAIERRQQILLEEAEVERQHHILQAKVHRVAEANLFRDEQMAEAHYNSTRLLTEVAAHSLLVTGEAEAEVIRIKGQAEAEALALKAKAWASYPRGAHIEQLVQTLPEIVEAVSKPLSKVEDITLVSSGGADADIGAARLTGEVVRIVGQLPTLVQGLTGVDIANTVSGGANASARGGARH